MILEEAPEAIELAEKDEVRANPVDKFQLPSRKEVTSIDKFKAPPSIGKIEEKVMNGCDLTKEKWVYDDNYPLYTNGSCPLIDEGFNNDTNGRRDKNYMKWKWQLGVYSV
ncbi:hypothetical protein V6N13_067266 [Hibiscus sabdariffa]|uniref:Trichome birefringence-like N-terminal domain-containing protein n=1 Tax=Hibiscus sabdariffa TaxID=183260 RepID=A0ABR2DSX8_9ROSI